MFSQNKKNKKKIAAGSLLSVMDMLVLATTHKSIANFMIT